MPLYEHVFLARQDASTQQVEELTTQMTGIVEQAGGKVTKTENWGVRSLTYRMNKNRKAHFVLLNIDAPSAAIAEIERQERISEDVIRYLSVRVEEHEEGPSAMMRKADRDRERDDRGGFRGDRDGGGGIEDSARGLERAVPLPAEQHRCRDRPRVEEPRAQGRRQVQLGLVRRGGVKPDPGHVAGGGLEEGAEIVGEHGAVRAAGAENAGVGHG